MNAVALLGRAKQGNEAAAFQLQIDPEKNCIPVRRFASLIHGFAVEVGEKSIEKSSAKHDTLYKKVLQVGSRIAAFAMFATAASVFVLVVDFAAATGT